MLKCPRYFFLIIISALYFSNISGAWAKTASTTHYSQHKFILKSKASIQDCFDFFIATIGDDDDDIVYGKKKTGRYFSMPVSADYFLFSCNEFRFDRSYFSGITILQRRSPLQSSPFHCSRCLRI